MIVNGYEIEPGADLNAAVLTGADLRNIDLTGADLHNSNLTGVDLTGANLNGIFSGAIKGNPILPTDYILVNGYIIGPGVSLYSANLGGSDLTGANMVGVDLTYADLTETNMMGVSSGAIIGDPINFSNDYILINGYIVGPGVDLSDANLLG
ncbi:pentapeptide repeat-containing protein, partial [Paracoccaceae bacterium]|nr:pentapeptide repeat-containing protein [Paracoccaceae bacterium]